MFVHQIFCLFFDFLDRLLLSCVRLLDFEIITVMMHYSYVNAVQGIESSRNAMLIVNEEDNVILSKDLTDVDKEVVINTSVSSYNTTVVDNNSHPLFIHNNDHPRLVLIPKKLVGLDSYAPWSRSMQIALNAMNKFVIVNGTFVKPEASSPLFAQWERVSELIITWILNSVTEEISDGLNFVTTGSEVWSELHERFSGVNGHKFFQVMKDIHSLE